MASWVPTVRWLTLRHIAVLTVAVLGVTGCSGSGPEGAAVGVSESALLPAQDSGELGSEVLDSGGGSQDVFEVVQASGYVRRLLGPAGRGIEFDYEPMRGAGEAVAGLELIVAGYVVEIAPGVVWADTRVFEPWTQVQIEGYLQLLDEREESLRALGALGPAEIATLERERRSALENKVPEPNDIVHAAYRVRVTEVLWGDFEVGGVLDVQVPLGVFTTLEEQRAALVGTPRAVVGGRWSSKTWSNYELESAQRVPLADEVFYPWIELFWLDESVWDPGDLVPVGDPGPVGDVGVPGDGDGAEQAPGGDDGDGSTGPLAVVNEEALIERPAGPPEALYLRGLSELHEAWGDLGTLDDLADALRAAAAAAATPTDSTTTTTTTTAPPTDSTTTTTVPPTDSTTTTVPPTDSTTTTAPPVDDSTTTTVPPTDSTTTTVPPVDSTTTAPTGSTTTTAPPVDDLSTVPGDAPTSEPVPGDDGS